VQDLIGLLADLEFRIVDKLDDQDEVDTIRERLEEPQECDALGSGATEENDLLHRWPETAGVGVGKIIER
jgi:hypothetical protein